MADMVLVFCFNSMIISAAAWSILRVGEKIMDILIKTKKYEALKIMDILIKTKQYEVLKAEEGRSWAA